MLYANSPVPLYKQLYNQLRTIIEDGNLAVGKKLPSERQLAAEYGISRLTARKALTLLRQEGYVQAYQGKGSFVAQSLVHSYAQRAVQGFSELMLRQGRSPSSKILSCAVVPVSGAVAEALQLREYGKVIRIKRLRLANQTPMAVDTAYLLHPMCAAILTVDLEEHSLYRALQQTAGITFGYANETYRTILGYSRDLELLQLSPPTPVMQLRRQTYDTQGRVFEYVEVVYRKGSLKPRSFSRSSRLKS